MPKSKKRRRRKVLPNAFLTKLNARGFRSTGPVSGLFEGATKFLSDNLRGLRSFKDELLVLLEHQASAHAEGLEEADRRFEAWLDWQHRHQHVCGALMRSLDKLAIERTPEDLEIALAEVETELAANRGLETELSSLGDEDDQAPVDADDGDETGETSDATGSSDASGSASSAGAGASAGEGGAS